MKKIVRLIKEYYIDSRKEDTVALYKVGYIFKLISAFVYCSPLIVLFFTKIKNIHSLIGVLIFWNICFFMIGFPFLYISLLAQHIILTDDSIEYVQYLIKRRKIKLCDIKSCQTVYLNGIAEALQIMSNDSKTVICITYSFFNSYEDLKQLVTSIGFPDSVHCKKKHILTEEEKKKRTQAKIKKAKKILNAINLILLFEDISVIVYFIVSYYFNLKDITMIFLIIPIILGWRFSSNSYKKTKKYSLKKMVIQSILSIILFCLIFFISVSLYSYFKFGNFNL